jgi:hypothetical protein
MSNAALRAQSAISCFSHVRSAACDPAGLKLAEGLLALAQAIEGLAAEQADIRSRLRQISCVLQPDDSASPVVGGVLDSPRGRPGDSCSNLPITPLGMCLC